MIDFAITRIEKKTRTGPSRISYVYESSGKDVLIWAGSIYNKIAPRFRHRGGTMIGDLPMIDTPIFLGFLSKIFYCINSEGTVRVLVTDDSVVFSYPTPTVSFAMEESVPRTFFQDASLYRAVEESYQAYVASHDVKIDVSDQCYIKLIYDAVSSASKKEYLFINKENRKYYLTKKEFEIVSAFSNGIHKNSLICDQTGYSPSQVSKTLKSLREKGVIV